jgi:hypothetical protein
MFLDLAQEHPQDPAVQYHHVPQVELLAEMVDLGAKLGVVVEAVAEVPVPSEVQR